MSKDKLELALKNFTNFKVDLKKFKIYIAKFLQKRIIKGRICDLSILFVNKNTIRNLNKEYRKKDETTDVLSFNLGNGLGEIFINPFFNEINKKKDKDKAIMFLIIHGLLHLLGFDDYNKKGMDKMIKKGEELLNQCKL